MNALVALGAHLGVGRCHPFSSDTAVRISQHQIRYPDLGVDCGIFRDEKLEADAPQVVFEILSDSTRAFDFVGRLEEYKSVPSLRDIVLADTDEPKVIHCSRPTGGAWAYRSIEGPDSTLELPGLGFALPLRVLYAGLTFRAKPRLVVDEAPTDFVGTDAGPVASAGTPSAGA